MSSQRLAAACRHRRRGASRPRRALARPVIASPCAGVISYAYPYHWPIDVELDRQRLGFGGWPLFAVQTSLTLVAAIVSYRVIEQPVRRGAGSSRPWRALVPATALAVAIVVMVVVAGSGGTRPALAKSVRDDPVPSARRADETAPPDRQRIMIVGDSVAYFLGKEMQHIRTEPPLVMVDAGYVGCNLLPGVTRDRAAQRRHARDQPDRRVHRRGRPRREGVPSPIVFCTAARPTNQQGKPLGLGM